MSRKNVQRKQRQQPRGGAASPSHLARSLADGLALHRAGRLDQAEKCYRDILARDAGFHDAWHLLGLIAQGRNQLQEAAEHIRRALALKSDEAVYHHNLAVVLRDAADHVSACRHFGMAAALDPNDPDAPLCRAELLRTMGDHENAVPAYTAILRRNPGCVDARRGLATVLGTYTFLAYDPHYDQLLTDLLTGDGIDGQLLARPAASMLEKKYTFDRSAIGGAGGARALAEPLGADRLFTAMLTEAINISPVIEAFLVPLRAALLAEGAEGEMSGAVAATAIALAHQGINNGYLYPVSDGEAARLDATISQLERELAGSPDGRRLERWVLLVAMYRPLHPSRLSGALAALPRDIWSPDMQSLINATLHDPLSEERLREQIPVITGSGDRVSGAVRAMYEESPYPRWKRAREHTLTAYHGKLSASHPWLGDCGFLAGPCEILIAGCGTGRHPIEVAMANPAAKVTALDLSTASLAYGARMARDLKVRNIRFVQGDILDVGAQNRTYDVIESVGVLHHMADPLQGWRILVDCLRPGGLMRIGLYSRLARQSVNVCREHIRAQGLHPDTRGMDRLRSSILNGDFGASLRSDVVKWSDFFYTNGVRDLLFHVMEHQFDLDQIGAILHDLGLDFISFEPLTRPMQELYRAAYPADTGMRTLAHWSALEAAHTDMFRGMYQFWTRKITAG